MRSVLFVCTGNTCRSPMAEAIMKDKLASDPRLGGLYVASSAGTSAFCGDSISPYAISALEKLGINSEEHRARRITAELVEEADCIIAMEARHMRELIYLYPNAEQKARMLKSSDISDPFSMPLKAYMDTANEIANAIDELLQSLADEENLS